MYDSTYNNIQITIYKSYLIAFLENKAVENGWVKSCEDLYRKEIKKGKLTTSRRYNQIPLLRSSPGGYFGSWPCRTYPATKIHQFYSNPKKRKDYFLYIDWFFLYQLKISVLL